MKTIPTAEDLLDNKTDGLKGLFNDEVHIPFDKAIEAMIEFAKLHVRAAVESCIEDAPSGSSTDTVSYEDVVKALKDSYPLTNIK